MVSTTRLDAEAERKRRELAEAQRAGVTVRGPGTTNADTVARRISTYRAATSTPGGNPPSDNNGPSRLTSSSSGGGDWRDSIYNTQIAAINRALADYETGLQTRTADYGTDYLTGLRKLGYRPGSEFQANVDIFSLPGTQVTKPKKGKATMPTAEQASEAAAAAVTPVSGAWDYEGEYSPFSSAAQGTRSTRDQFAGRGALRSSFFGKEYADFQNRLADQLNSMETGRTRFFRDSAMDLAQQRTSAEEQRQQARREALLRAAAASV